MDINPMTPRSAHWGHWGISFISATDTDGRFEAYRVDFPVGPTGPAEGHLGSPERQQYRDMYDAWVDVGTVPEGATEFALPGTHTQWNGAAWVPCRCGAQDVEDCSGRSR